MKLRLRNNSIRIRLTQKEVENFATFGRVEDVTEFGPDAEQRLAYALEMSGTSDQIRAVFACGRITLVMPKTGTEEWIDSDQVSFSSEQPIADGRSLKILIERDFACLKPRPGNDDEDAFPHPLAASQKC